MEPYYIYSNFLKEKYGEKVYRIPINLPLTCPNRDGKIGVGGCTFCGDVGAGFESRDNLESVEEQLQKNINYIGPRYHAKKFIAYFQNYTNTYIEQSKFEEYILSSIREDVVEIAISTRPDCVTEDQLNFLKTVKQKYGIEVNIELGLQTVNYHTLKKINRGHTLAEFIDCVIRCKKYNFQTTVHMILNLPQDSKQDVIEGAKILSSLEIDGVKLHSLYIPKGSRMAEEYEANLFEMSSMEEYIERVALFLSYLSPNITIQRIIGRAPEKDVIACNFGTSWWKIKDYIIDYMNQNNLYQGCHYNYLGGKIKK